MRRENSTFNMSFLSKPGVKLLHNNDYYGCSRLDDFACYVVADGLGHGNGKNEDPSARLAVEAVISAFNQKPSMSRGALSGYLNAAHRAMLDNNGKRRLRASITIVVTNYQRIRYGFAGNCRFQLYRGGRLKLESGDHSLSWELAEEGQLSRDKIAFHEERNNLSSYCGTKKSFQSTVGRKIKLRSSDIFSLYTRGIWENADTNDMITAIQAGENDPEQALEALEHLILDKIPPNGFAENYTACFVFVDKVYLDPNKSKRIKLIVTISIIVIVAALVVTLLVVWNRQRRQEWLSNMQIAYHNGIEYIQGNNFIRAKEELDTAYELAERLRDAKHKNGINSYILLTSAVIYADDLYSAGKYEEAVEAFGAAARQSRYADNLAAEYIENTREKASDYLNVHELIFLGDSLAEVRDWANAEEKYLAARGLASRIYYSSGKKEASEALEALYQAMEADILEQQEQATQQISAAELIIQGDKAAREGDLTAATLLYQLARDKYEEMGSQSIVDKIDEKLLLIQDKLEQNQLRGEYASKYMMTGDELSEKGEYVNAKRFYLLAREIYAQLDDAVRLDEVKAKIELTDLYLSASQSKKEEE